MSSLSDDDKKHFAVLKVGMLIHSNNNKSLIWRIVDLDASAYEMKYQVVARERFGCITLSHFFATTVNTQVDDFRIIFPFWGKLAEGEPWPTTYHLDNPNGSAGPSVAVSNGKVDYSAITRDIAGGL